ncbi:MAG: transposase, partial [Bacteroidetes bacterium]|nr:transposase [Bacteroidota bacterium]
GLAVGAGLKPAPTMATTGESKTHGLSEIVRALKTFSARKINEMRNTCGEKLWQRNYYEHIIRNDKSYQYIADYIINNPAEWEKDKFYKK